MQNTAVWNTIRNDNVQRVNACLYDCLSVTINQSSVNQTINYSFAQNNIRIADSICKNRTTKNTSSRVCHE